MCLMVMLSTPILITFFFCNDTATTEIYPLSLHDALPISSSTLVVAPAGDTLGLAKATFHLSESKGRPNAYTVLVPPWRSEEHTSELQSRPHLVCRLLLEK